MRKQENEHKYTYDIGLVYRSNHNYGANLTHYSLYYFLCSQGYRVLMIDLPWDSKFSLPIDRPDPFELYQSCPYSQDSIAYPIKHRWDLLELNALCKFFIVGSDQLWRRYFVVNTNYFSTLDWVDDDKYKISYATSFGVDQYEGNQEEKENVGKRLSRIQRISVREKSGVKIVKELTGKEAQWVVDPVFICDKKGFAELAQKGRKRMPLNKYVAAYLLDRDAFKNEYIYSTKISQNICESVLIEDAMVTHVYSDVDELNPLQNATVEEWLAMIENCECFITDSFHGICFAIMYKKQFVVIISNDSYRGYARIESLLQRLGLENRIVKNYTDIRNNDIWDERIDYRVVDNRLNAFIKEGKDWLLDSLNLAGIHRNVLDESSLRFGLGIQRNIDEEKKEYIHQISVIEKNGKKFLKKGDHVYIWGTGACFRENIKILSDIYMIEGTVDSDPQKWGRKVGKDIWCISPKQLFSKTVNISVIVLIEDSKISENICDALRSNGIVNCITYKQLMR